MIRSCCKLENFKSRSVKASQMVLATKYSLQTSSHTATKVTEGTELLATTTEMMVALIMIIELVAVTVRCMAVARQLNGKL
jgi:hypothetical protein